MIALACLAALAAPPEVGAGLGLFVPAGDHPLAEPQDLAEPAQLAPELAARASGFALRALGLEAEIDAGYGQSGAGGVALAGLRAQVHLRVPGDELRPGLVAGGGVLGALGPGGALPPFEPALHAGLAVAARAGDATWLRFDLRQYLVPGDRQDGQRFGALVTWTRELGPAAGARVASGAALPPVDPPEARLWLPHPTCRWVDVASAGPLVARLPVGTVVRFTAPGYLPRDVVITARGLPHQRIRLVPVPPGGSVVAVGQPGDEVAGPDGTWVPTGPDGVAILPGPVGETRVALRGGGRYLERTVATADGYAAWVHFPHAVSVPLYFAKGSAELSPDLHLVVSEIAAHAGSWSFDVRGSASPEGDVETNLRLATERAENIAALLRAAGVPADRLRLLPSGPAFGVPSVDQRFAEIIPRPPETP